ncbi:TPA: citrate/2-methylcitrate synthase, partial [Klebsiella pneumoniae]
RLLGVKPATLYTYVSRGLLQSYPGAHKKERLYLRQDVERLRALGHIRSGERFTANEGLRWGEPIIQTSITQLTPAGPKYRNRLATDLVRSHGSFESVAELLWSGTLLDEHTSWRLTSSRLDANRVVNSLGGLKGQADLIQLFTLLTLTTGIAESERSEVQNGTTTLAARHIIAALVGSLGFLSKRRAYAFPEGTGSIAEAVAQSFSVTANEESIGALNATLVLSADHELAPATFAARVAAASGAGLHSCITSAL